MPRKLPGILELEEAVVVMVVHQCWRSNSWARFRQRRHHPVVEGVGNSLHSWVVWEAPK